MEYFVISAERDVDEKTEAFVKIFLFKAISMLITRRNYVPSYVFALLFHAENYKLVFSSLFAAVF